MLDVLYSSHAAAIVGLSLAAYVLLGAVYRLFLHPLRKIPGPRLAALTWGYEVYYDAILPGQYNFKILELHKKYGPVLRVNPDEVHVADPAFLGEIYNARKRNKPPEPSLDIESSVAGTAEWDLHKQRRQAMTSFFSPKAVRELEPLLARKRDRLVEEVERKRMAGDGTPLNLSDLYFAYCWDLIQEYAFAFHSDVLADLDESNTLRQNSTDLLLSVNFTRHFGWINALAALLPAHIGERMTPPGVRDLKRLAVRVAGNVREVLADDGSTSTKGKPTASDKLENSVADAHRSIFYTIRDDPDLPASEKQPLRLQREGNFLVVAGSDSPARAIHITHFHLLHRPECMERLRAELRPLGPSPTLAQLAELPYLGACVLEGTRLMFGLARRIFRIAPDDPIVCGDHVIPPGIRVATSSLAVHANESLFPDPMTFKPERWLGPDAADLRRFHMSFGAKSPRSCLGVHLADAELRFALAAAARFDMQLFETGVADVAYLHDFQMAHGDLKSPGIRALVTGKLW